MSTQRTAKHLATKIVSLLAADYTGRWEIGGVRDVAYGQELTVIEALGGDEFVVTVQKHTLAEAIAEEPAEVDDDDDVVVAAGADPY